MMFEESERAAGGQNRQRVPYTRGEIFGSVLIQLMQNIKHRIKSSVLPCSEKNLNFKRG